MWHSIYCQVLGGHCSFDRENYFKPNIAKYLAEEAK